MTTETAISTDAVVREAVETFAREAGEDANTITVASAEWASLIWQGVSVDLTIGGWTAETTLAPDDLGLTPRTDEERDAWEKTLILGRRRLLPKPEHERIAKARGKLRGLLYDASYKAGGTWFVSTKRYSAWKTATIAARDEYLAAWQDVLDRWDELQTEVRHEYTIMGYQNYLRFRDAGVTQVWGRPLGDEQDYLREFVERTLHKVPTREYVQHLVRCEWRVVYHPLAELIAQVENKSAELEAAKSAAQTEMERDVLASRADREALARDLQQFAQEMMGSFHVTVYDTLVDALAILQGDSGKRTKGGDVRVPVRRLKNLVEYVQEMKLWPDGKLDEQMARLHALVDVDQPDARDREAIERVVRQVATESRLLLAQIDWPDVRSARNVGIPDDVVELEATVARHAHPDAALDTVPLERARSRRAAADEPEAVSEPEPEPVAAVRRGRSRRAPAADAEPDAEPTAA